MKPPLFPLGRVVATPGALAMLERHATNCYPFLLRHESGSWGDIHPEDVGVNEEALTNDLRIMSVYSLSESDTLWIITEADRSATTCLLPEEY